MFGLFDIFSLWLNYDSFTEDSLCYNFLHGATLKGYSKYFFKICIVGSKK